MKPAVLLFALAVPLGGCASSQTSELRRCESEKLGGYAHYVESFKRTVTPEELDTAVGEMSGIPAAELYELPVHGPIARAEIAALEAAAEEGATLWIFEGWWPSWEGIAAVRDCQVIATATLVNH